MYTSLTEMLCTGEEHCPLYMLFIGILFRVNTKKKYEKYVQSLCTRDQTKNKILLNINVSIKKQSFSIK